MGLNVNNGSCGRGKEGRVVSPKTKHLERLLNGEMEFFNQIVIIHYRKDYSDCEVPLLLCHSSVRFVSAWLLVNYVFLESFFVLIMFQKRLESFTSARVIP